MLKMFTDFENNSGNSSVDIDNEIIATFQAHTSLSPDHFTLEKRLPLHGPVAGNIESLFDFEPYTWNGDKSLQLKLWYSE